MKWCVGPEQTIDLEPFTVMGILNVTPDSFSDGGEYDDVERATNRALRTIKEGATIIDIGGESTRPGADAVSESEQIDRTAPVIESIREQSDVLISIDTTRSAVAAAALDAGANIINNVSAGLDDEAMLPLAAERSCGLILMHRLTNPASDSYSDQYDDAPEYEDVVETVKAFLSDRVRDAKEVGVDAEQIVLDPGLGFGKTVEQNFELIRRSDELLELGFPVLAAASRKSFIGAVTGVKDPSKRIAGSIAASLEQFRRGARLFRVHDVQEHVQALRTANECGSVGRKELI